VVAGLARAERHGLVTVLEQLGPDEPTLCEGWTTRDLAAHVILRETRPDAAIGIAVPALAGHTARVQERIARDDWQTLLNRLQEPPWFSPWRIDTVNDAANLAEFFVHHEDARRAQPGWKPRSLSAELEEALWRIVTRGGRLHYRRAPVGIRVTRPDDESHGVKPGSPIVMLTGEPGELLLYAYGRRDHALVTETGPPDAVAALRRTRLGF
jgi:uncharacterized protein (TIGR03085 family)